MAVGKSSRVLVGRFGAAVGLRGDIRLQSFTGEPQAIVAYGPLSDAAGKRAFKIESLRAGGKGALIARVAGVRDRTAAEALTNIELYADRANMPAEDEDEFYIADLIGLAAVTPTGEPIGEIFDAPNYGAGDLIEVRPANGGDTLLFPFTRAVVPEIDIARRRVVIVAPAEIDGEDKGAAEPDKG